MFANKVKKVAAIHDLSGMGRVSLTVVIPILSSMGFQVCPLPTAILSNHTQYPDFTFLDLTDEMPRIIAEWKRLEVEFDAIYTGYLGSPRQIQIVSDFIRDFRRKDSLTVIDPVLGDNGKLYSNFNESMVVEMQHLVTHADVITPNLTELFYLLDRPYKESNTDQELKEYLRCLSDKRAGSGHYHQCTRCWTNPTKLLFMLTIGEETVTGKSHVPICPPIIRVREIRLRVSLPELYCRETVFPLLWTVLRSLFCRAFVLLSVTSTTIVRVFCWRRYFTISICPSRAAATS